MAGSIAIMLATDAKLRSQDPIGEPDRDGDTGHAYTYTDENGG